MKKNKISDKLKGKPNIGILFILFLQFITLRSNAQYHIAWTRTFKEGNPITFYPADTKDGVVIPILEDGSFKVIKLNRFGKMVFKQESSKINDYEAIDYRDFFPDGNGQLFQSGYGSFFKNTQNSTCVKRVDKNYNTLGFGGLVNIYKKPTSFWTSSGYFEFSDSSVAKIELARIEKYENAFTDLVFTKYDKKANLTSLYINKDWRTDYLDFVTYSSLRWKTFSINDSLLMLYGGHRQKDSVGFTGFLILNGNGKIVGRKDELDILNLRSQGIVDYLVLDVTFSQNKFYISYYISLLNNVAVNIRKMLICNSNFDTIINYPINPIQQPSFIRWANEDYFKIIGYLDDSESNNFPTDRNRKLCIFDTLANSEKCFQLKKILGNEYWVIDNPKMADYNTFSLNYRIPTFDGGILLLYTRKYPYYEVGVGGYSYKTEEIVVKISPGNGIDTVGHEPDDVNSVPIQYLNTPVKIFPNPNNSDFLQIDSEKWQTLTFYNKVGQIIEIHRNSLDGKKLIDISHLTPGSYLFKLTFPDRTIHSKLLRY